MFADFVARILRRSWDYGSNPLKGKDTSSLTPGELAAAISSTSASLKQFSEEVATLNGTQYPLSLSANDGKKVQGLSLQNYNDEVPPLPPQLQTIDYAFSALLADNPISAMGDNGHIYGGTAGWFRGVVKLEGANVDNLHFHGANRAVNVANHNNNININNFAGNTTIINGGVAIFKNGTTSTVINGGSVYINNSSNTNDITVITGLYPAIANGAITARSGTTYGAGYADRRVLFNGAMLAFSETVAVLNPHDFAISNGTHLVLGKVSNGFGNPDAYLVVEVDGTFQPHAFALRNNADQSITGSSDTTITLYDTTPIHKYPNDSTVFTVSSSVITIKKAGLYRFSYIVGIRPVSTVAEGNVWVEEGSSKIAGSVSPYHLPTNSTAAGSVAHGFDHVVDADDTFRLRINSSAANYDVLGSENATNGGYSRLDIRLVRSV